MATITDTGMKTKPKDKDQWKLEAFARGSGVFCGRITPSGERLFYFRYSDSAGRRPYYPIGPFCPDGLKGLTVAQARAEAQELSRIYRTGAKDLHAYMAARENAKILEAESQALALSRRKTVTAVFEDWVVADLTARVNSDGKRQGRKDDGEYTRNQFTRYVFPSIGQLAMEDVTKSNILGILDTLRSKGTLRTANVVLTDLKQFFTFAVDREVIKSNPIATLTKKRHGGGEDVIRTRFLSEEELRTLAKLVKTSGLPPRSAIAIYVFLSTACRLEELVTARWENIHLNNDKNEPYWYIPKTKNQRDHKIHLSNFAIKQFKALKELQEASKQDRLKTSPWVFPNTAADDHIGTKTINAQYSDRQATSEQPKKRRTKKMNSLVLPGGKWNTHDLRRTASTYMAMLGISTDVIHECQNHIQADKMSRVYIQDRRLEQQRVAFNKLGNKLAALTKPTR